jgi:hypothetical protein
MVMHISQLFADLPLQMAELWRDVQISVDSVV